jgi:phage gp29-like protein
MQLRSRPYSGLVDHRGNPVEVSRLDDEESEGSITSVRSPFDPMVAMGLTPKKLHNILVRAAEGDHDDYLAFAAEMERRDGHYFGALQQRINATAQLEFCIKAASEEPRAVEIAKDVERMIKKDAFGLATLGIMDAVPKGFSVTEIIWKLGAGKWAPDKYRNRNPRWFSFDRVTGEEIRLNDGTPEGQELSAFKYIVHKPHIFSGLALAGGLARIVAALHLFKGYAIKDWLALAEVTGIPIRIGKYPKNATKAEKQALKEAVRDIGSDAAAIIPATMEILFEKASMGGFGGSNRFHQDLILWCNDEVSKAVNGQTMTIDDGSSWSQAMVHNEVRGDIRNSDAWQFGATVNRDLVIPYVDLNYGVQEEYPYFYADTDEPEDLTALAQALIPFVDRGLLVPMDPIYERFGIRKPAEGEPVLGPLVKSSPTPSEDEKDEDEKKASAILAKIAVAFKKSKSVKEFKAVAGQLLAKCA